MKSVIFTVGAWCRHWWAAALTLLSRCGAVVMSSRGLTLLALVGCGLLIIGPWLRSSISRDFRAIHIPWNDYSTGQFLPEYVAEVPRAWRWESISTPLLVIAAGGILIALWRPRWTCHVFGLLLAVSLPALAVALWNHPGLIEFFDGETRERSMLRIVYRQRSEDMMANRAPDRLRTLGETNARDESEAPIHPLAAPFRYSMYGPWLLGATFIGAAVARRGSWPRRFAYAGKWAGAGVLLAAAVTWPRWIAEYHWARAEAYENANQFPAAEQSLRQALETMPRMANTNRYWLAKGRLGYRQHRLSPYVSFFLAHQHLESGDWARGRAEIEYSIRETGGATAQRVLLAEIIGHVATDYVARGKHSAAELAWGEAADIVPWKPAYWIGQIATILAADPQRSPEVERLLVPCLQQIGDCFVSSDLASMIGDAYFETGEFDDARDMYSEAMELFHLPKYVNLHAQEGRLGM